MGYYLGTARLNQYTLTLYAIIMPWSFHQVRSKQATSKIAISLEIQEAMWAVYLLFAAYNALSTASNPMSTNLLANYELFNPFTWDGEY